MRTLPALEAPPAAAGPPLDGLRHRGDGPRATAVVPGLLARLWRAACEIDEAQAAAWLPLLDDDT